MFLHIKMVNFILAFGKSHALNLIVDEEFVILYDLKRIKSSNVLYWLYENFVLGTLNDAECIAQFTFLFSSRIVTNTRSNTM